MTSAAGLIDQVVDYAVVALSPDGTIESWNAGAERLKGYASAEALGLNFSIFYSAEDQAAGLPRILLAEALAMGSAEHSGWRLRKDGTRFWGDVIITVLRGETGVVTGYVKITRDVTEQHRVEQELKTADQRLRILVNTVVDYAIIALSPGGIIESWNAGAERLKGYTVDEAVGQHFSMLYPPEAQRAGVPQLFLNQARSGGSAEHTGWRVRKDGTRFWGGVVITALYDDAGALTGYVKVTRDLSALKQREAAQDTFYNAFEHDFRIPLTAIKGFAELARDARPAEREGFLDRVDDNAHQLLTMVEDFVAYARLREGRIPIKIERVDLAELTERVVENLVRQGARITIERVTVAVLADPAALHRVIANLINNALKYSADNTEVICTAHGAGGYGVLRITDHGRGIDARDLDQIFNEFERGRLALSDSGTGLGLASAQQLVRLQGGTIAIESSIGVGTTVTIRLPLAD